MSLDSWTSRKFSISIGVLLIGTFFVFFGKANFYQWKGLVEWVLVTYVGGNLGETAIEKFPPPGK